MSTLLARMTETGYREPEVPMSEHELIARLRDHFGAEHAGYVEDEDARYNGTRYHDTRDEDIRDDDIRNADAIHETLGEEVRIRRLVASMADALRAAQLRVEMIEAKAKLAERRFTDIEGKLEQAAARWQAAEQRAARAERFLAQFHQLVGGMLQDRSGEKVRGGPETERAAQHPMPKR